MTILSVLPNLDDIPADNFVAEFPATTMVGLNLNQKSPAELKSWIIPWDNGASGEFSWGGNLARSIYLKGRQVLWSVPFPGALRMEEVNEGKHDDLYLAVAMEILRVAGSCNVVTVYVRLPWEFNLDGNIENRMLDKFGKPAPVLGKLAWRRIAALFRSVSVRFKIIWSPSVERANVVDPEAVWPGLSFVDIIAPDLYMCRNFGHTPGVYVNGWFRDPLLKLREFACIKNRPFGLAEVGVDSEDMRADIDMALNDTLGAPSGCFMIQWWNDWQQTDTRIVKPYLPQIAAVVASKFPIVKK